MACPSRSLGRDVIESLIKDGPHRDEYKNALLPPFGDFFIRRQFFDIVLDFVEQPDEVQVFLGRPHARPSLRSPFGRP